MIYIHVPFCRSFCTYCGFYSEICRQDDGSYGRYADAILREAEDRKEELSRHATDSPCTLYIGGGTPSVLPLSVLGRIVEGIRSLVPEVASRWEEFTVELNPDDVLRGGPAYLAGLKGLGVTRVSMGIQSFDDGVLKWMNRRHDSRQAEQAFRLLRSSGFGDISIDLIFGYGSDGLEESVARAVGLFPEHISAYQLSVEEGSALEEMVQKGLFREAEPELCRQQYDFLCRSLADAGYEHYEISNFALPGHRAVHNSGYWRHCRYVGLGPGAHSFDGMRKRSWNEPVSGELRTGGEELSDMDLAQERLMLGLRTSDGVDPSLVAQDAAYSRMLGCGALVRTDEGRIRIPESRFFVSDDIIAELTPAHPDATLLLRKKNIDISK